MKNTRNKVRLTESQLHNVIKESVKKVLNEIYLNGGKVDFSDWHICHLKENGDGYYDFEAKTDNGWYTLRGSYDKGEIMLDELLSGHSGYGRNITISDKLERWFDIYCKEELIEEIEYWLENDMEEKLSFDDEYIDESILRTIRKVSR